MNLTEGLLLKKINHLENTIWEAHHTNSKYACDCPVCKTAAKRKNMVLVGRSKYTWYWTFRCDEDSIMCNSCTNRISKTGVYKDDKFNLVCEDCYWEKF